MLAQFTWQQFLLAAMILSLIWYAGVMLVFYRNEFLGFFGGKSNRPLPERLPRQRDNEVPVLEEEALHQQGLMGKSRLPEGMSTVAMGSFGFSQTEEQRETQVGLVPDVLQELKEIFSIIEKEDGSKKDFFNLMDMVREKFPGIASNPNIPRINQYIREHAPFLLTAQELENLWD